ncbi:hypothetical protein Tco_1531207 [Tanacetum coccineum]
MPRKSSMMKFLHPSELRLSTSKSALKASATTYRLSWEISNLTVVSLNNSNQTLLCLIFSSFCRDELRETHRSMQLDQDKSSILGSEDEPRNANMETKVESMVTVPIHQASSSVPPLSTPVIDLTPPKPVSSTIQEPVFTPTTETTTTTLPPPPPQQQSTTDPALASRVSALETICANFEKRHKLQDKTVQGLSSRVFTLELLDLPHNIDQTVNEVVKEAVQTALQAPLQERFKDLSEADMKEILHQ